MEGIFDCLMMSRNHAKQPDEFSDELCDVFGRCVPQKHMFFNDIAKPRIILAMSSRHIGDRGQM